MAGEKDIEDKIPKQPRSQPLYPRPELLGSIEGIFDLWWAKKSKALEICVPAIFLGYDGDDRSSGMAWVQPLVRKVLDKSGTTKSRKMLMLPVRQMQHGTFSIDVPLVRGDTGWIIAADRDTTLALRKNSSIQSADSGIGLHDSEGRPLGNSGQQTPQKYDFHKYSYGFFLPDKWGGVPLPQQLKDSLVIGQVNSDGSSRGRYVLDPDGTVHILSKAWYDADAQKLRGGAVFVDLSWKGKIPAERKERWHLGKHEVTADQLVWGNLFVDSWTAPDGSQLGGSVTVGRNATVKGGLTVNNSAKVGKNLSVKGKCEVNDSATISKDNKAAIIDPTDMGKSEARFRVITVVTGVDEKKSKPGKVVLKVEKRRVLSETEDPGEPIVIEGGGGGGGTGTVEVDDRSVGWMRDKDGQLKIELKNWHDAESNDVAYTDSIIEAILNNSGSNDPVVLVPVYTGKTDGKPNIVYFQKEGHGQKLSYSLMDYLAGSSSGSDKPEMLVRMMDSTTHKFALKFMEIGDGASGTVIRVRDIRWNMNRHTLQKQLYRLDLRTGQESAVPGTIDADGWENIVNGTTTPISSIISS